MKKVKKMVIYAVIIVAVVSCAVVAKNKMSSSNQTTNVVAAVSKVSVEVQTVKKEEKNTGDTYKATLEAHEQGIVTSKISAKVNKVLVENGQFVNAGDTIAVLDDQDIRNNIKSAQSQLQVYEQQLNSSNASLEKSKINLNDAQRSYERQKTLFEAKAISQTDFESAEKALNTAKADYNSALSSIEASKANIGVQNVTIANYQDNLKNAIINAPISGVISDKSLSIGQMASPGTSLVKVNDISSVYATIQIPQDRISSVKIGQSAVVTIDGCDQPYNGTVKNIDALADATARVFNCKVIIDNSNKTLYPGIFGKVNLINEQKTEIIRVPINALVGTEGDYSIFINDNGTAKKQKVTIGETDENNIEITSGVQDGDQIICSNTTLLQDGSVIEVVTK